MRVGLVDAGSNTVRLVVTDATGGVPLPVHTAKWKLRLSEQVGADGYFGERATEQLVEALRKAVEIARRWGAPEPLAFATAVVRNAPDRVAVLRTVAQDAGIRLCVLPGEVEAQLTFLGVRRWMGWRAGPLAVFDIGGGSFEVAFGRGRMPEFAVSLPLGAGRLTNEFLGTRGRRRRTNCANCAAGPAISCATPPPASAGNTRTPSSPPPAPSSSWPGCAARPRGGTARSPSGSCAGATCAGRSTGWPPCR
jgi:exopolyphosphatase/pppGpp-phosphohydrolase